jgi:hypothetical protein
MMINVIIFCGRLRADSKSRKSMEQQNNNNNAGSWHAVIADGADGCA